MTDLLLGAQLIQEYFVNDFWTHGPFVNLRGKKYSTLLLFTSLSQVISYFVVLIFSTEKYFKNFFMIKFTERAVVGS